MILLRAFAAVVVLLFLGNDVQAYKIAIFVPDVSNSQIIWNYRLAETLQKAGHQVTLLRMLVTPMIKKELPLMEGIEQWKFYGYNDLSKVPNTTEILTFAYEDLPLYSKNLRKMLSFLSGLMVDACENFVQNKDLLKRLTEAKFDLAFADMAGMCSVGLIHHAKIPTWIWMNNAPLLDFVADLIGVHSPSSYIPSMFGAFSDAMTFPQRIQNFLSWTILPILFRRFVAGRQTEMFRQYVDPNFPSLADLAADCPLIMVNSDELYAVPRPILHKTVYIGGLGMNTEAAKPLTGEFKTIADKTSNIIVFSFGSIANASLMPETWKNAFMNSFKQFPEVEFFMRYDIDDLKSRLPSNVHPHKWLPQSDLINLPKTRALISHGGYNSMQEAINSGTPLIAIPLFGDQPANARLVEKHGLGIMLKKSDINEKTLTKTIKKILEDDSYSKAIQRMREMIRKKPFKPDELVVRWTDFVAEFKDLPNLTPHGAHLGFIKYYCIDVVAFLLTVISLLLFGVYKLLRYIVSLVCRKLYVQKKKKE